MKLARFLGIAVVTTVGLTAAFLLVMPLLPRPPEVAWIVGIYERKTEAARAIPGPKLVLIGGSATHFSYSAKIVSDIVGRPVVNFGVHAGLGGDYLLYRARQVLRPGDTAIIGLEHALHFDQPAPTWQLAAVVVTSDHRYLLSAPRRELPNLVFGYSPAQILRQEAAADLPPGHLYNSKTVDGFGDETANTLANKLPFMKTFVLQAGPLSPQPIPKLPAYIVDFIKWAKANDVVVIHSWPPTVFYDTYKQPFYHTYFDGMKKLYESQGVKTIGEAENYELPVDEMFDSQYHANSIGQTAVSQRLGHDLCEIMTCEHPSSPTDAP